MSRVLVLSYSGCQTCRNALRWLAARGVEVELRPIVERPPTASELKKWIPASRKPLRKWLNTSGQSYRALGKAKVDSMSDSEVIAALTQDGKLVKRPVLVMGDQVQVGFDEEAYAQLLER